jgi:hypothetical protein
MKTFLEWMDSQPAATGAGEKPWRAKKEEVIRYWQQLAPNRPFTHLRVIPSDHKGPTLGYDGIRVTGSSEFIECILARLKDVMPYEGSGTRLQVIYKQQFNTKSQEPVPDSYVLYLSIKERE